MEVPPITSDPKIYKILLTGGPMAGKSTGIHHLSQKFRAAGLKVFTIPEIATDTINNGFLFYEHQTFDLKSRFNYRITKHQYDLEDYYNACAEILRESQGHSVLVIYDRGILDNWSYITMEVKDHIYAKYNWTDHSLLNGRYNGVFHLVTVADMDSATYTDSNDQFGRIEQPEESVLLDKKNRFWYLLEENFWVIDNPRGIEKKQDGVDRKMDNLYGTICQVLGLEHALSYAGSKFLGFKKPTVLEIADPERFYEDWDSIGLKPIFDSEVSYLWVAVKK
jgi:thymidylate kinase